MRLQKLFSPLLTALLMASCELSDPSEILETDDLFWNDDDDVAPAAREGERRVTVRWGPTTEAERVKALPVGRSAGDATRRIVMRLGPADIPDLASGDVLMAPAEVQITTRCDIGQSAPGCDYNPKVRGQLILTGRIDDKSPDGNQSKALSEPKTLSCTKAEHHCKMVFRPSDTLQSLTGGFDLPCVADDSCFVNLVMWAWHPAARADDKDVVLVGENEGNYLINGEIRGDKGRLMVIRERGIAPAERVRRVTRGDRSIRVPTNADATLVYSHRLKGGKDLVGGEQFVVEAKIVAAVSSRARFSTQIFLTRNPSSTGGGRLDGTSPGSIGEHNGINCTAGTSPCTTRRVAVFRVDKDIRGPVFVNVDARSAVPGGGSARVVVDQRKGWLRSTRYRPELR